MREIIPAILMALMFLLAAAAMYYTGYVTARLHFSRRIVSPWLDWRGEQIAQLRPLTGAAYKARADMLDIDQAAYDAMTRVLYSYTDPWEKPKQYTRGGEA